MKAKRVLGFALSCVVVCGAASSQEALTDDAALAKLAGVWSLVEWNETLSDGSVRRHPVSAGRIIYTELGEMCAVVMDPNRPQWASALPTAQEALDGMNSGVFYAYCARAEMHAAEGYALHHAIIDKIPNNVGAARKRWFEFLTPDRIVLRIDEAELRDPVVRSELTWERVIE